MQADMMKSGNRRAIHPGRVMAILVLLIATTDAGAQVRDDGQDRAIVSLSVEQLSATSRSYAPIMLEGTLRYRGTGLLEGHLLLSLYDDFELLGTVRVDDFVLSPQEHPFRLILPPTLQPSWPQIDLKPQFVTEDRVIEMTPVVVRVPKVTQRYALVGLCSGSVYIKSGIARGLVDALDIDQFNPVDDADADDREISLQMGRRIGVFPAWLDGHMPSRAIDFCSFDIVVVFDHGLSSLRPRQTRALLQWIEAGGSSLIIPSNRMESDQAEFLNCLTEQLPDAVWARSESGQLLFPMVPRAGGWFVHKGLGCVVVLPPNFNLDTLAESDLAPKLAAFLWNVRSDQPVRGGRPWNRPAPPDRHSRRRRPVRLEVALENYGLHRESLADLRAALIPEGVRMVPLSLIMGIMIVYLLAIGPGDYLLLGLIRRRHFTWWTFPVVTVAFTGFTVWLSHDYMASNDSRITLTFHDVIEDGRVARSNSFELLYTGTHQEVTTDLRTAVFSPIPREAFRRGRWNRAASRPPSLDIATLIHGRFPGDFSATQQVPQWTAQLNRILTFPVENPPEFRLDWELAGDLIRAESWNALADLIERSPGDSSSRKRLNAGEDVPESVPRGGDATAWSGGAGPNVLAYVVHGRMLRLVRKTQFKRPIPTILIRPRRSEGLFGVVHRIAPTGAGNIEDLTLLDPTDLNQRLLCVIIEREGEILVFRRLYVFREPDQGAPA